MAFNIIALLSPKPGMIDRVEELLKETAIAVKANEPGTLKYQIHRETKGDAPAIIMLEMYKDRASLQAHGTSEDFKNLERAFKKEELLASPMKVLFTKESGGFPSKL
ncbi:hypothetical protein P280DRAFT_437293 [Massarina eburnea CBS 473.64]|uniref:ABM domain-containing protein n=1 Tax=Massarina eburnea CBS 473.64 TaxID=1395130 RepID=A0A6A6RJ53_9PLEO|nr:hypothetical protein P280DRAFT_437293 [Massarina eburnea CBS 473.64]